jgi:hypothetical protein
MGWNPFRTTTARVAVVVIAFVVLRALAAACFAADETKANAGEAPAWQGRFQEVYRLVDGENAKLIPTPFIPERADFHRQQRPNLSIAGQYRLRWAPGKDFQHVTWDSEATVATALSVAGLDVSDLEGLRGVLDLDVPGDWVARAGAPRDAILADVQRALAKATDGRIRIEHARVEKPVIVARGRWAFKRLPNAVRQSQKVHLFTDTLDAQDGAGGGSGSLAAMLKYIGHVADQKMIDETEPHMGKVTWKNNASAGKAARTPEARDQLLKNISDQTSLTFVTENRTVDVWRVIDTTGKAGGL